MAVKGIIETSKKAQNTQIYIMWKKKKEAIATKTYLENDNVFKLQII